MSSTIPKAYDCSQLSTVFSVAQATAANITSNTFTGPNLVALQALNHMVTGSWTTEPIDLDKTFHFSAQLSTGVSGTLSGSAFTTATPLTGTFYVDVSTDPGFTGGNVPGTSTNPLFGSVNGGPPGNVYNWTPALSASIIGSSSIPTMLTLQDVAAGYARLRFVYTQGTGPQVLTWRGKGAGW